MRRAVLPLMLGVVIGCSPKTTPSESPAPTPPTSSSASASEDIDKLQGTWELVEVDRGPPPEWEPPRTKEDVTLIIKGKLVRMIRERRPVYFIVSLNPTTNPKQIDLTESDETGDTSPRKPPEFTKSTRAKNAPIDDRPIPRRVISAIYMFEGEILKIAQCDDAEKRPTDFTPRSHPHGIVRIGEKEPPQPPDIFVAKFRRVTTPSRPSNP